MVDDKYEYKLVSTNETDRCDSCCFSSKNLNHSNLSCMYHYDFIEDSFGDCGDSVDGGKHFKEIPKPLMELIW